MAGDLRPPAIEVSESRPTEDLMRYADQAYRKKNPGRRLRGAFDAEHLKRFSRIVRYKLRGYKVTRVKDLGLDEDASELFGPTPDSPARIGDLVLMDIPEAKQKARERALQDLAEQHASVAAEMLADKLTGEGVKGVAEVKRVTTTHDLRKLAQQRREVK